MSDTRYSKPFEDMEFRLKQLMTANPGPPWNWQGEVGETVDSVFVVIVRGEISEDALEAVRSARGAYESARQALGYE